MAFPTNLTNAVDGVTDVVADHLNNLEAKVGIDGSLVTTSLDYLLKNPASIDPGHLHSNYQLKSDSNYITALTGDVAASGPGAVTSTIQAGVVSLSKMANLAANSIIGNNTASPATPLALSASQVKALLAIGQADVTGLVSDLGAKLPIATYQDPASISPGHRHVNLYKPDGSAIALTVNTSGSIGIGTTTPTRKMDVYAGTDDAALVAFHNQLTGTSSNKGFQFGLGTNSTGLVDIWNWQNAGIQFGTNNTQRLLIDGSGNIGIGGITANAAALLHLSSTTKGFLPPVMTTTQKSAISSPPAGLVVYDSTLSKLCVYTGSAWETITSA